MIHQTLVFGDGEFFHWGDCLPWSFEVSQTQEVSDSWDLVEVERPRHRQADAAGAGYPQVTSHGTSYTTLMNAVAKTGAGMVCTEGRDTDLCVLLSQVIGFTCRPCWR